MKILAIVMTAVATVAISAVITVMMMWSKDAAVVEATPPPTPTTTATSSTIAPTTAAPTTAPPTTAAPAPPTTAAPAPAPAPPRSVHNEPGGLFCRDLHAKGYSYGDALDYWNAWGQPDQMDADLNGTPCETVYSAAEVPGPAPAPRPAASVYDEPGGLFCRDLHAKGYSYGDALDYWGAWGYPDQMDADLNGIPCETVYSAAEVYS